MKRKVLQSSIFVVFLCLFFQTVTVQASSYAKDYRYWSQGSSEDAQMRRYGCWVTAQAKMIYEAGINRSTFFNPDVYLEWERENGYINDDFNQVNGAKAPVAYAKSLGKELEYLGYWDADDKQLWSNINSGYYTILKVSGTKTGGGYHFVLIANELSKKAEQLYCYDSWNSSYSVEPQPITRYSIHNGGYVYQIPKQTAEPDNSSETEKPTEPDNSPETEKPSEREESSEDSESADLNGLHLSSDGNWYKYVNGKVDSTYNGLYYDTECGWWLVFDGRVAFEYTGLYNDLNCGWWLIDRGTVAFYYTGLYNDANCGWWLVDGGTVAFYYTGLYNDANCGWWLVDGGTVAFYYTGLYNDANCGWWYIEGGTIVFSYTGQVYYEGVPYNVVNGQLY